MNNYLVSISPKAVRDLREISEYISTELESPIAAKKLILEIRDVILSLENFPERGSVRKIGQYAHKGYRQLFVKNYTIVYRVNHDKKQVIIVTICYTPSLF